MKMLPKARNENLVVQNAGKELLIYDLITHKAYNLNETSAIVFNACNGATTFEELKRRHKFTDDLINFTLDELSKQNMLADNTFVSPFAGMTRREVVRRVGLATLIALPLIASLTAPTAAHAQSGDGACSCPESTIASPQACLGDTAAFSAGCVTLLSACQPQSNTTAMTVCCSGTSASGAVFNPQTGCCSSVCASRPIG